MKKIAGLTFLLTAIVFAWLAFGHAFAAEQTWTGTIADSICGASHQAKAASGSLKDRQCTIECIKALATYVLIDEHRRVIRIANQDFPGLPLRAGRLVKVTGELKGDAIAISSLEPMAK